MTPRTPRRTFEPLESRMLMAVISVLNNNDSGAGSLRDAIAIAAAGDTVDLSAITGTINLTTQLTLTKDVTLVGPGRDRLTLDGGQKTRVMSVAAGVTARISDLTVARGGGIGYSTYMGGGINSAGNLILERVTMRNNAVLYEYGGYGGALYSGNLSATDCEFLDNVAGASGGALFFTGGTLALERCTFARNSAGGFGGDYLGSGGAMRLVGATGTIINCTISGNNAKGASPAGGGASGGGIYLYPDSATRLDIVNTTITNNRAGAGSTNGRGGGIGMEYGPFGEPRVFLANSVIAGNVASTQSPDIHAERPLGSRGHNLIGAINGWYGGSGTAAAAGDRFGNAASPLDPFLRPLAYNGGTMLTHRPLPGSLVIDHGDGSLALAPTTDQNGTARSGPAIDSGAVEHAPATFTLPVPALLNLHLDPHDTLTIPVAAFNYTGGPAVLSASELPDWLTFVDNGDGTGTLSGTCDATPGSHLVVLEASDGFAAVPRSFMVHVAHPNVVPTFTSAPVVAATAGMGYSYKLTATDAWGDRLAFQAVSLPSWLTLQDQGDGTATLFGNPSNANAGPNVVTVAVTDGAATALQTLTINVASVNHYPTQPTINFPTPNHPAFQPYSKTFNAFDEDGDVLTLSVVSKPSWMTFTSNGGGSFTMSGTPSNANTGGNAFTIRASDGSRYLDRSYSLNVTYVNRAPTFTTTTLLGAYAHAPYSEAIVAGDPDNDALTITTVSKPTWLTVATGSDGVVSVTGTPPASPTGSHSFTLRVSDSRGAAIERTFAINLINRGPSVGLVSAAAATAEQPFSVEVITADVDIEPVTIVDVIAPAWLQFTSTGPGSGVLSGLPTNADAGGNSVTFFLNDGHGTVERTLVIPVAYVNHAPTFVAAIPPTTAYFDTRYSYTFQAADTDADTLAITATGLPHWLTLVDHGNGTATLSGVPTDPFASSHAITLRVGDGATFAEQSFTLSVPMERFRLDDQGTLTVMGGVGRDAIQVWVREGNQLRAVVNGVIRNYSLSAVTGLAVYGLDENDSISVNTRTIASYVLGGGGNDTLLGGEQRDTFIGGGGHDRIYGDAGDDRLSGLAGNDYLEGGSGQDVLTGGDGADYLVGNSGMDRFYGDGGNDTLIAKDLGYDILHGGDGDDLATYDPNDLLHELFATPA